MCIIISTTNSDAFTQISSFSADKVSNCGLDSRVSKDISMDQTCILIEKVETKQRALDFRVFRGFTVSTSEYIADKFNEGQTIVTETDAINYLMPGYDDQGNYIHHSSPNAREVQFVSLHRNEGGLEEDALSRRYERQHGVTGVVTAQIRCRDSTVSSSLQTLEAMTGFGEDLPQHVYLANLRVDDEMRRKGVGSALLNAVIAYTQTQDGPELILLNVELDNLGAIQLYERGGFHFLGRTADYGTMYRQV